MENRCFCITVCKLQEITLLRVEFAFVHGDQYHETQDMSRTLIFLQKTLRSRCAATKGVSHSVVSDSLRPHGLQPAGLLCPWNSPGKNTGVVAIPFSRGIFPIQGSNLGLPHCRQVFYHLNHQGSPKCGHNILFFLDNASKAATHGFGQYGSWEWWTSSRNLYYFSYFCAKNRPSCGCE